MRETGEEVSWMRPKNDFVFKLLFGREHPDSKALLLAFINDLFNVPSGQSFGSIEILNPLISKEMLLDKASVLDVHAKVTGGMRINVEIQLVNQYNMDKRTLYYGAKLIEEQLLGGQDYKQLRKVVTVNLLDFRYFSHPNYRSSYRLLDAETGEPYPDLLQLQFLEMPKFTEQEQAGTIKTTDRLAKWIRFLTNEDDRLWSVFAEKDEQIRKAVEILRAASHDPETRRQYEVRQKALRDYVSMKEGAKEEGREEGREEGKVAKGKDIALKMLRKGLDVDLIIEFTELSREEIEELKKEL